MKTIYCKEGKSTVCAIAVRVEFSKEIAYWDSVFYHENPKFAEFWDKVSSKPKYRDNLWSVGYTNEYCKGLAEEGKLEPMVVRYLSMMHDNTTKVNIRPTMSFILMHDPSEFPTTHAAGLNDLITLCKACARYCGGTVDITYSSKLRYFEWVDVPTKTITVGKGIRKYRIKEIKAKKKCEEVEHVWEHSNKEKIGRYGCNRCKGI